MPEPITVTASEPQPVDLFGHEFTLRMLTRSVKAARNAYAGKIGETETDGDSLRVIGELLDAILELAPGKRKKPSAVVLEKWNADEISQPKLLGIVAMLCEAQDAEDPT